MFLLQPFKTYYFCLPMIPAEIKKKENIAEYIIHMYQTEDLITTYDFNLDDIFEYVIRHMSKDERNLKSLLLWYADLIEKMQAEGLPKEGQRLAATQYYVNLLSHLHTELLETNTRYSILFKNAKDDIMAQISFAEGKISDPVQICLNAIYGRLIINLNGKKLSSDQEKMIEKFAAILKFLSAEYHKSK